jgi:hypothetical protein
MSQFLFAKQLTASLAALARFGVADHMSEEPVSAEALAAKVGAHAPSLYRVMRMLAAFDVFREDQAASLLSLRLARCSGPTRRAPCATWP